MLLLVGFHTDLPRYGGAPRPRRDAVRIAIWNVAGYPQGWEHMRSLEADLLFVQESAGAPPPGSAWKGYEWFGSLDPGVPTRYPAPRLSTRRVGPWIEPLLLLLALPGPRRVVVANVRLVLPSSVTWVAGGFSGGPREGFEARVGQYGELAALVRESMAATGARSAIVAGDFNAPAQMPSLEPLRAFLMDAWRLAGRGWGATATADPPLARIDQCWVTPDIQVIDARVRKMPISDHRPLWVELTL